MHGRTGLRTPAEVSVGRVVSGLQPRLDFGIRVSKKRRRTNIYLKEIPKNSKLRTLNLDMSLFVKTQLQSFRSNRRTSFSLPPSVPAPNLLPRCDCAKYAKDSKLKVQSYRLPLKFTWLHDVGIFVHRWLRRGLYALSKSPANEGAHSRQLIFPPVMVLVNIRWK